MTKAPNGFWYYEWGAECPSYTPGARSVGLEYWEIRFGIFIPNKITDDEEIDNYIECYPEEIFEII